MSLAVSVGVMVVSSMGGVRSVRMLRLRMGMVGVRVGDGMCVLSLVMSVNGVDVVHGFVAHVLPVHVLAVHVLHVHVLPVHVLPVHVLVAIHLSVHALVAHHLVAIHLVAIHLVAIHLVAHHLVAHVSFSKDAAAPLNWCIHTYSCHDTDTVTQNSVQVHTDSGRSPSIRFGNHERFNRLVWNCVGKNLISNISATITDVSEFVDLEFPILTR